MSKASFFSLLATTLGYRNTYILAEGLDSEHALTAVYYDGTLCCQRVATFLGTTTPYRTYEDNCNTVYAVHYGAANGWQLPGYQVFPEGLANRYLRGGSGSAQALIDLNALADNAAYMRVASPGLNDEGRTSSTRHEICREFSYCILLYTQLARCQALTADQITRRDYCYTSLLTIINDWVGHTASYNRPFMDSIVAHGLIEYYFYVASAGQKTTILNALASLATVAWDDCWNAPGAAFTYTDRDVGVSEDLLPQPDLNMLIAPWYAWLWSKTFDTTWKTKAESIFTGGESHYDGDGFWQSGAYLGTLSAVNPIGKHIDQQLVWATPYFTYIETEQQSAGVGGGRGRGRSRRRF